MQVQQLLRIAGVGVLVTVISQILTRAGREDIATMTTIAGLVIVLMMVVTLVAELLSTGYMADVLSEVLYGETAKAESTTAPAVKGIAWAIGLAVLGALAAVMLKRQHQALGWAAAAFAGAAVLMLALDKLGEAADVLRELAQCAQLQEGQLALILRILGVALVSELAAQACRDAGEEGLALHVETGAKVILLLLSAPLLRQLAGLVMELTA